MTQQQESQLRFNVAYISVLLALFIQFGGVVWYASALNTKVLDLGVKFDRLETTQKEDSSKASPIIYGYQNLVLVVNELRNDIKDLKKEYKK